MDRDNLHNCNAEAIDYALLVFTLLTTHLTWWALHIPKLWKESPRAFLHDVAWECSRMHIPSVIAIASCLNQDHEHWAGIYYTGVKKKLTKFELAKSLLVDSFLIVSSVLSIYRLLSGGEKKDVSGINSSLWAYPSLPIAIIGIWITIASFLRLRFRYFLLGALLIIGIVCTAIAVPIRYLYEDNNFWLGPTIPFIYMSLPLGLLDPRLALGTIVLAGLARFGGPVIGAVSPNAYFPFCPLRGWGFSGPFLAFGILASLLGAYGFFTCNPRGKEQPPPPARTDEEMQTV